MENAQREWKRGRQSTHFMRRGVPLPHELIIVYHSRQPILPEDLLLLRLVLHLLLLAWVLLPLLPAFSVVQRPPRVDAAVRPELLQLRGHVKRHALLSSSVLLGLCRSSLELDRCGEKEEEGDTI